MAMLTPTPTLKPRRQTTRTKTGCLTCRQRRVKCDEAKPSCQRCLRAEVDCCYGLRLRWPQLGAKMGNNRTRRCRAQDNTTSPSYTDNYHLSTDGLPSTAPTKWGEDTIRTPIHSPIMSSFSGINAHQDSHLAGWIDLVLDEFSHECTPSLTQNEFDNGLPSPTIAFEQSPLSLTSLRRHSEGTSLIEMVVDEDSTSDNTSLGTAVVKPSPLSISMTPNLAQFPQMTAEDGQLFQYYVVQMCPKCVIRNGYNKTYRQVVLPLVDKSTVLLKAILAITANRIRLQDARFGAIALHHQAAVLQGLQQALNKKTRTSFSRLEILSTILMLCFYEICNPGSSSLDFHGLPKRPWKSHSGGIRQVLEQRSCETHDSQYEKAIVSFSSQYFASRSVLTYSALSPMENPDELIENAQYWLNMADRPSMEINPFAGCSNEMLGLILTITSRLRQLGLSNYPSPPKSEQLWADMMQTYLLTIEEHLPNDGSTGVFNQHGGCSRSEGIHLESLEMTSKAFRLAALILLGNFYPDSDIVAQERRDMYLKEIGQILESGIVLPRFGRLGSSSYAWPYLIAGSHLHTPDQQASLRPLIQRVLVPDGSQSEACNTTTGRIYRVLEDIWSQQDVPVGNGSRSKGHGSLGVFLWESATLYNDLVFEWV